MSENFLKMVYRALRNSKTFDIVVYIAFETSKFIWYSKLYHSSNGACGGFAPRPLSAPKMSKKKDG